MSRVPETLRSRPTAEGLDALLREEARRAIPVSQSDRSVATEDLLRDNVFVLSPGEHPGMRVVTDGTLVRGMGDALVTRLVTVDGSLVVFDGVRFQSRPQDARRNNQAALATLSATSRALFRGCTFRAADEDAGAFVTIAAGGLARFVGCAFLGGASKAFAIDNAGIAANVFAAYGSRPAALAHNNVTSVSEMLA